MAELKHIGRVKDTNKKCIVAYRTLPGDAYNCLIVPTENLPDSYHDAIINLVESNTGQSSYEFAEAMTRTNFPDGTIMLAALHTQGRLVKVSTSQIEMTPNTNARILLSELNQIIAEQRGVAVDQLALRSDFQDRKPTQEYAIERAKKEEAEAAKTTSAESEEVAVPTSFDSPDSEAKFYRSQADKLAKQAAEMRRKAEELVPTKKAK
jgi:hypothetical protein